MYIMHYIYTHLCMYVYLCIHACVYIYILCMYIYTCICTCMDMYFDMASCVFSPFRVSSLSAHGNVKIETKNHKN